MPQFEILSYKKNLLGEFFLIAIFVDYFKFKVNKGS